MAGRWTRKALLQHADDQGVIKRGSVSVRIWPNGDIMRNDVELHLCSKMSCTEAAQLLKLKPA